MDDWSLGSLGRFDGALAYESSDERRALVAAHLSAFRSGLRVARFANAELPRGPVTPSRLLVDGLARASRKDMARQHHGICVGNVGRESQRIFNRLSIV